MFECSAWLDLGAALKSEKILRRVDDIYLIDSLGNILISDVRDITDEFVVPSDEDYDQVLEGKPVFITDKLLVVGILR